MNLQFKSSGIAVFVSGLFALVALGFGTSVQAVGNGTTAAPPAPPAYDELDLLQDTEGANADSDNTTRPSQASSPAPRSNSPSLSDSVITEYLGLPVSIPELVPAEYLDSTLIGARESLLRILQEKGQYSGLEFRGFSDVRFLARQTTDSDIYAQAVEEIVKTFSRATHSFINILLLTERLENLRTMSTGEKLQRKLEGEYSLQILPLSRELISQFAFANSNLIDLLQKCTKTECLTLVFEAQDQLIQFGRFINKEKHVPTTHQFNPLVRRALEELEFRNSNQMNRTPEFSRLFKNVLDIFHADLDHPESLRKANDKMAPLARWSAVKTAISRANMYSDKAVLQISDPVILAELEYIKEIENDVSSHINTHTPLHTFKKKPRYHHHKLHCKNTERPGAHLVIFGRISYDCSSDKDHSLSRLTVFTAGPGLEGNQASEGVVFVDSISSVTPFGTWIGSSIGFEVNKGVRYISGVGHRGSIFQGAFLDEGFGLYMGASKITLKRVVPEEE